MACGAERLLRVDREAIRMETRHTKPTSRIDRMYNRYSTLNALSRSGSRSLRESPQPCRISAGRVGPARITALMGDFQSPFDPCLEHQPFPLVSATKPVLRFFQSKRVGKLVVLWRGSGRVLPFLPENANALPTTIYQKTAEWLHDRQISGYETSTFKLNCHYIALRH